MWPVSPCCLFKFCSLSYCIRVIWAICISYRSLFVVRVIAPELVSFNVDDDCIEKVKQSKAADLKKKEKEAIRRLNKIYIHPQRKVETEKVSFNFRKHDMDSESEDLESVRYQFDDPTLPDLDADNATQIDQLSTLSNLPISNSHSRLMSNMLNTSEMSEVPEELPVSDEDDSDDDVYDLPATALKLYDGDWTDVSLTSFLKVYDEESLAEHTNSKKQWIVFSTKLYDDCNVNKTPGQCKSKVMIIYFHISLM